MQTILFLAGLPIAVSQHIRSISSSRFVPNGDLIRNQVGPEGYTDQYADILKAVAHALVLKKAEDEGVSVILAFVDYGSEKTRRFVLNFFPFALPLPLAPFDFGGLSGSANLRNRSLNEYSAYLINEARRGIDLSGVVRKYTNVHNLTPLLLPVRNFRSNHLSGMLDALFWNLSRNPQPDNLISQETDRFFAAHPWARRPGDDQHCLSDGVHYFRSPGRARHGFFRYTKEAKHNHACLLNARSRLGGSYEYKFHYDCNAVTGGLCAEYPNCHDVLVPPKDTHANIAPNDYVLSTIPEKEKRRAL